MRVFLRICAFFCLLVSAQAGAYSFSLYHQGFEGTNITKIPYPTNDYFSWLVPNDVISGSFCYTTATKGFNTFETSTRFARSGTKSVRVQNNGMLIGSVDCGTNEPKQRAQFNPGFGIEGIYIHNDATRMQPHGDTRWFGMSFYYPSDEGTATSWWSENKYSAIFQIMATGNSATPEVFVSLGNGGKVRIENRWSTNATTEEKNINTTWGQFQRDTWNDVVIQFKRAWDNTGIFKMWINGVQVTNRVNTPVSIRDKPGARPDYGHYFGTYPTPTYRNQVYVEYIDAIRIGDDTSSFAEVDPSTYDGPDDPPPPDSPRITSANSGSDITDEQFPVNFTVSDLPASSDIVGCVINDNDADERPVNYSTATSSGVFAAGDIDQYSSSSATLKCYHEQIALDVVISDSNFQEEASASDTEQTDATWGATRFGYTSGLMLEKTGSTTYATGYRDLAEGVVAVANDTIRFDFTYSCDPLDDLSRNHCENLYFSVDNETINSPNYPRHSMEGTAGALALGALNGGWASNLFLFNKTLYVSPDFNVYRAILMFKAPATEDYKIRFGTKNGFTGQQVVLHEVRARKNWTTQSVSYPITLGLDVADGTGPDAPDCTSDFVFGDDNTDDLLAINCTLHEVGGTLYLYRSSSATPPSATDLKAGTGAGWHSIIPVNTDLVIADENAGAPYAASWIHSLHRDDAGNDSAIATAKTTIPGGDPTGTKKFKWSSAGGNAIYCYSASTNSSAPFNGDMSVIITDGDYFSHGTTVTELAYAAAVSFTNGEGEIDETGLTSGSINSLSLGDHGYNYWAKSSVGTCRVDNEIQVIEE